MVRGVSRADGDVMELRRVPGTERPAPTAVAEELGCRPFGGLEWRLRDGQSGRDEVAVGRVFRAYSKATGPRRVRWMVSWAGGGCEGGCQQPHGPLGRRGTGPRQRVIRRTSRLSVPEVVEKRQRVVEGSGCRP